MSAPDTNIEKQERDHKAPLLGIRGVVIFAVALLLGLLAWLAYNGNEPGEAEGAAPVAPSVDTTVTQDNPVELPSQSVTETLPAE